LTLHWLLSTAAALTAIVALIRARRVAKRLERLTESYWELRYDYGQLRSRLAKLEPPDAIEQPDGPPPSPQGTHFVPLSSLRR
jgi:hypothetical protein